MLRKIAFLQMFITKIIISFASNCFIACLFDCWYDMKTEPVLHASNGGDSIAHHLPRIINTFRHVTERILILTESVATFYRQVEINVHYDYGQMMCGGNIVGFSWCASDKWISLGFMGSNLGLVQHSFSMGIALCVTLKLVLFLSASRYHLFCLRTFHSCNFNKTEQPRL